MQVAGSPSWQIAIDQPQHLLIGLFIRDAARLPSAHTWLPAIDPAVPREGTITGSAAAAEQWDRWWDRTVRSTTPLWGPPFESLQESPELREVVATLFQQAVLWSHQRAQEHIALMIDSGRGLVETNLVAGMERDRGEPARPFHLRISEVPCAGPHLWRVDEGHILITADLLRDHDEYVRAIAPIVQALF
ncbi:MAG: hypothetical protein ABI912_05240 [Actinomycetota bacterium]